jgi:hypothetical protein
MKEYIEKMGAMLINLATLLTTMMKQLKIAT